MQSVLAGDSTLNTLVGGRIYSEEAPQGAAVPMVVFAHLGGSTSVRTLNGHVLTSLYMVRAIDDGESFDGVVTAVADRIDTVLTVGDQGTVVDGVRITKCRIDQPHQRKDASEGVPIVYMGAIYRVYYQPASQ